MKEPTRCPECNEIIRVLGNHAGCPNGHGRLVVKSLGMPQKQFDKESQRRALPTASIILHLCDANGRMLFTLSDISGIFGSGHPGVSGGVQALLYNRRMWFVPQEVIARQIKKLAAMLKEEPA